MSSSPATWGYYVGDEITPSVHAQWKVFTDIVHQTDPNHPRLYMASVPSYHYGDTQVGVFADGAEVLGQDYYPIGVDYMVPYTQTNTVAKTIQSLANSSRRDAAMNLQATSWTDYYPPARCNPYPGCAPFPSFMQLQQMLKMAVNNSSMRLILYYSYFDILRSDNPTQHWNDLVTALQTYSSASLPFSIYDNSFMSSSNLGIRSNNTHPGFQDLTTKASYTYLNSCDRSTAMISAPCSYAIALQAQKGLYWKVNVPQTTTYTSLEWNMNTSGQPITDYAIGFLANGIYHHVDLTQSNVTDTFTGNGWMHVVVPISQFNLSGAPMTDMKLVNISNTNLPTIRIDDMTLL